VVSVRPSLTTVFLIALAAVACLGCHTPPEAPLRPSAWVTDKAEALSIQTHNALDSQLEAYEKRTGHQVIVWIDRALPKGVSIEAFGLLAFNSWGIGRAGHDDGVVLFVFADDHALRIQVGYGLGGTSGPLSDRECVRIIRAVIVPKLQRGDKDGAVSDGVAAILAAIEDDQNRRP